MAYSCALPGRALLLISEYSKPLTHPEWRYSKPIITTFHLYLSIWMRDKPLHQTILYNIRRTEWYEMYMYIKHNGLEKYCQLFDRDYYDTYEVDGVYDAMIRYEDY
jgi:hypothetical protein